MSAATTLINFHSPNHLKNRFDLLCRYNGTNRTALFNTFMRQYIEDNEDRLEKYDVDPKKLNQVLDRFVTRVEKHRQPAVVTSTGSNPKTRRWEDDYLEEPRKQSVKTRSSSSIVDDPFDNGTPW